MIGGMAVVTDRWDPALDRGLQSGLLAFRWIAGGWMVAILLVDREALGRPVLAVGLVGAAMAVTVAYSVSTRSRKTRHRRSLSCTKPAESLNRSAARSINSTAE